MTLVIHEAHKRRINIGVRSGVIKMNRKTKLTWTTEKEFIVVLEKKKKEKAEILFTKSMKFVKFINLFTNLKNYKI